MVVGAVAGVVGLVLLLKGSGGGGGTTAAGTSINAALGSIEEENMNLLGTTQTGFANLSNQMAGGFANTNQNITTGFLNTQNQLGAIGTDVQTGNQQSLSIIQGLFKNYAIQNFGYSPTNPSQQLDLPTNWIDYQMFLWNPSLADPTYQSLLRSTRGWTFESGMGGAGAASGGTTSLSDTFANHNQTAQTGSY